MNSVRYLMQVDGCLQYAVSYMRQIDGYLQRVYSGLLLQTGWRMSAGSVLCLLLKTGWRMSAGSVRCLLHRTGLRLSAGVCEPCQLHSQIIEDWRYSPSSTSDKSTVVCRGMWTLSITWGSMAVVYRRVHSQLYEADWQLSAGVYTLSVTRGRLMDVCGMCVIS